jgi:hypothetical protein
MLNKRMFEDYGFSFIRKGAARADLVFVIEDFAQSADMTIPFKTGFKPYVDDFPGKIRGYYPRSHGEHVCIVVPTAEAGCLDIVTVSGIHTGDLVRSDAHPHSGSAQEQSLVSLVARNDFADTKRDIRVIT